MTSIPSPQLWSEVVQKIVTALEDFAVAKDDASLSRAEQKKFDDEAKISIISLCTELDIDPDDVLSQLSFYSDMR